MPRRAVGFLLLTIVVTAAMVGGRLGGVRIAGDAVALPRLGVPDIGDCVASVLGPVSVGLPTESIVVTMVGQVGTQFSDCSGEHVGEVVAYRSVVASNPADASNDQWCGTVAAGFQPAAVRQPQGPSGGQWAPETDNRFLVILGGLQGTHAFKWAACAVISPGFESYRGSYVLSLAEGPAPGPFGLCRTTDESAAWASCSAPHRVQVFGTTTASVTPESSAQCLQLITGTTGMRDTTAGQLLRPELVASADRNDGGSDPRTAATAICRLSVVGAGSLGGTLVGLGDNPLPWA